MRIIFLLLHIFKEPGHVFILNGFGTPGFDADGGTVFEIKNILLQSLHKIHIDDNAAMDGKKIGLSQYLQHLAKGAILLDDAADGIKEAIFVLHLHHDNLGRVQPQGGFAGVNNNGFLLPLGKATLQGPQQAFLV